MLLGVRDRLPGRPQLFRVTVLKELPGYQRELKCLRAYIIRMTRPVGDNPGAREMVRFRAFWQLETRQLPITWPTEAMRW